MAPPPPAIVFPCLNVDGYFSFFLVVSEEVVQTVKIRGAVRLLVKRCNCVIVPYLLCLLLQGIRNTVGFLTVYVCVCVCVWMWRLDSQQRRKAKKR